MKKVHLLSLLLTLSIMGFSQKPLLFEKIIKTDSLDKEDLYSVIYEWFASSYNSSNDIIQMADKENGIIIGQGKIKYVPIKYGYICYSGYIDYTVRVDIKDKRYRIVLSNFYLKNHGTQNCQLGLITDAKNFSEKGIHKNHQNETWQDIQNKITAFSNIIFLSLESYTKEERVNNSDNW
ncbi:MAG: DUF4468 domain-containing protein [Bacteroidota bacterium]